jgi:hypothetical protein
MVPVSGRKYPITTKGVNDEKGKIVQKVSSCIGDGICGSSVERVRQCG